MLNKEHLSFRIRDGRVRPRFVDPAAPELSELAARLIACYARAPEDGMTRGELAELTAAAIRGAHDVKLAAGLNKLLLDRMEFTAPEKLDYPAVRRELFLRSGAELKAGRRIDPPNFDPYGDLPDFETCRSWEPITPEALLHRYDLAQAQGLLFYAEFLTVTVDDPDPAELRKLLKAIKFFRLLAKFTATGKNRVTAEISGPCSLFGPTAKYALNLACLLPAIVPLSHWTLSAQLKLRDRTVELKLDHKSGLVSHYRQLAGYIPEEIRLFHRTFAEKSDEWEIVGDTPFIDAGVQEIVFPDLTFRHRLTGMTVHAELFHRWHAGQLDRRIALLKAHPELPLILGIERALIPDPETLDARFSDTPELRDRCWLFRDFPGVETTLRALKKFAR